MKYACVIVIALLLFAGTASAIQVGIGSSGVSYSTLWFNVDGEVWNFTTHAWESYSVSGWTAYCGSALPSDTGGRHLFSSPPSGSEYVASGVPWLYYETWQSTPAETVCIWTGDAMPILLRALPADVAAVKAKVETLPADIALSLYPRAK